MRKTVAYGRIPICIRVNLTGTCHVADTLQNHMFKSTCRRHESVDVARRLLKTKAPRNPRRIPALRRRGIIRLTSKALRELEDTKFREKVMCEFVHLRLDLDLHGKAG